MLTGIPYGATPIDTAEYMLGDVLVSVVLIESQDVTIGNDTENWTPALIQAVKSKAQIGMQWWVDTLHAYHPDAYLNFEFDFTYADSPFEVPFEPINRISNQHIEFVDLFLDAQGYTAGSELNRIFEFNHAQRLAHGTDWAFTIFVVNDTNDDNDQFAAGGSFTRSFAYPGGRYLVTLASRPPEIYAHEAGHIFWAMDEYSNGSPHAETRGYYNTQNLNGINGAPSGHVQQASLMASGTLLSQSYINRVLPQATREHVGWRDSDGDGIIDILDVPLTLSGQGVFDAPSGTYRFVGSSQVQTLPNSNAASWRNDITLNRVRVAEYRLDGGPWTVAADYDSPTAELNLFIPVSSGAQQIEIRTRDTITGATSSIFAAPVNSPRIADQPGVGGFVFLDRNGNNAWDTTEFGLANRDVVLLGANQQPLPGPLRLIPDVLPPLAGVNQLLPGVTLRAIGTGVQSDLVDVRDADFGSYSSRVFANSSTSGLRTQWDVSRRLRIDFDAPQTTVSIDAVGVSGASYARLEAYNSNHQLLGRVTTQALGTGELETLSFGRGQGDIKYVIVAGHAGTRVSLDDLRIGPEVVAKTNNFGAYSFPYLPAGTYYVQASPPEDWIATGGNDGLQQVTYVAGQGLVHVNFGQRVSVYGWQNPIHRLDVNGDNAITPLDALLVIIDLNSIGVRELSEPPPSGEDPPNFIDVNGDGLATPLDALEVVVFLNSTGSTGSTGGSGEPASSVPLEGTGLPSEPEGESKVSGFTEMSAEPLLANVRQIESNSRTHRTEYSASAASPALWSMASGPGPQGNLLDGGAGDDGDLDETAQWLRDAGLTDERLEDIAHWWAISPSGSAGWDVEFGDARGVPLASDYHRDELWERLAADLAAARAVAGSEANDESLFGAF